MKTYYINQKTMSISDRYYIYDVGMQPSFEVTSNKLSSLYDRLFGNIISIGHTLELKDLNGTTLSIIKKRYGFVIGNYDIYQQNGKLASIHTHFAVINPKISISTSKTNYTLKGNLMARDFTIYNEERKVAQITKTPFNIKDKYTIKIFDDEHELLYLSSVIAIDNSYHQ